MKFYIDCEFDGHNGPLLSMAIVPHDNWEPSAHISVSDSPAPSDMWVAENVIPILDSHDADMIFNSPLNCVGKCIRTVLERTNNPIIIADSPVDIWRFCQALSTGIGGGWVSADYPRMTFEVHNVDCYPTELQGAVQHNAWWDAMALREKLSA